jgi:DNA polymerase III subunit delta
MAVLREEEFEAFVLRRSTVMNGILIHGSDQSAVSALGRKVVLQASSSASMRFDPASLKENPGRLSDEFRSISLLGDRQILLVEGVDDSHLKFLNSVVSELKLANFIILLADALGKTSKLRLACEASEKFASLAIYEEDAAALAMRVRKQLSLDQLSWSSEVEAVFFDLVGTDRSTATQEAAKLALYCLGQKEVSIADVEAVCGDTADFGSDQLIDAVLSGDLNTTDRMAANLDADSAGTRGVLSVFLFHLTRLQSLKMDMERGQTADMVVRNTKPAIFFKRKSAFIAQLRSFELQELIDMQQMISAAMLQTRKQPDLFEALVSRTLLSLARTARSKLN